MLVELAVPAQHPVVTIVNDSGQIINPIDSTQHATQQVNLGLPDSGESVPNRMFINSHTLTPVSGTVYFSYFTAEKTEPITQVRSYAGATAAAATPTLARLGIYSVAGNGNVTLLAATVNDTALWNVALTEYTRALDVTFSKVAGTRYATAHLIVTGVAAPTLRGWTSGTTSTVGRALYGRAPRLAGRITAQADLPASLASGSIVDWDSLYHLELLP